MGVTTSFFSATQAQLEAAAPGWVKPEYGGYAEKEVVNPFTREKRIVKQHELLSEAPEDCPPDEIHTLIKRERAYAWRLTGNELEPLMSLLTNAPADKVAELGRQALLGPEGSENWVYELPTVFVDALARLDDADAERIASAWHRKIEWQESPSPLLGQLREVAREAKAKGHQMFSYVCL